MSWLTDTLAINVVIGLTVIFIIFGPLVGLWALNGIGFTVTYNIKTWFCMLLLMLIFGGRR